MPGGSAESFPSPSPSPMIEESPHRDRFLMATPLKTTPLKTTPYAALRRFARGVRDRARRAKNDLAWSIRKRQRGPGDGAGGPSCLPRHASRHDAVFRPVCGRDSHVRPGVRRRPHARERGHSVIFARCFRLFERCPVMDMHRLPYEATADRKARTCLHCADNSLSMLARYGLEAVDLQAAGHARDDGPN